MLILTTNDIIITIVITFVISVINKLYGRLGALGDGAE